jgi:chromate reductase, NAD(P)H dehydrogenase (quinone)
MRVSALCGSLRSGSFNQSLLRAAREAAPACGLEIVQADISAFPLFNQDMEKTGFPPEVDAAKEVVRSSDCLLLVSPEANYGVPGVLKNAVDWLSRPYGDQTLFARPMALMGASTGYMGTVRAQLAWRQMWHFFRSPVFSGAELAVSYAAQAFDSEGRLTDPVAQERLGVYMRALGEWLEMLERQRR